MLYSHLKNHNEVSSLYLLVKEQPRALKAIKKAAIRTRMLQITRSGGFNFLIGLLPSARMKYRCESFACQILAAHGINQDMLYKYSLEILYKDHNLVCFYRSQLRRCLDSYIKSHQQKSKAASFLMVNFN